MFAVKDEGAPNKSRRQEDYTKEAKEKMKAVLAKEYDLYNFAKSRLEKQLQLV